MNREAFEQAQGVAGVVKRFFETERNHVITLSKTDALLLAEAATAAALSFDAKKVRDEALEEAARCVEDFQADKGIVTFTELGDAIRSLKGQSLPAAADRKDAEQFKPRNLVTLNGKQLKELLDYTWPDRDDEDQADSEVTLIECAKPFKSTDGHDMPAGIYFYCTEYPEEGIVMLSESEAAK